MQLRVLKWVLKRIACQRIDGAIVIENLQNSIFGWLVVRPQYEATEAKN
jgi:hypothetical protein